MAIMENMGVVLALLGAVIAALAGRNRFIHRCGHDRRGGGRGCDGGSVQVQ